MTTQLLTTMADIAAHYDCYIFDIWGCLHNGQVAFAGAVPVLRGLKSLGKKIYLLSNSPSRLETVKQTLAQRFGITPDLYDGALNSGEATYRALRDRSNPWHAQLGTRYYFIDAPSHAQNFTDLPYTRVDDLAEADFIIITRTLEGDETVQTFEAELKAAIDRGLPMICANPDRHVSIGTTIMMCPGELADWYSAQGGDVVYHGKPYRPVYEMALHDLGNPAPARVLAIGDGMMTDILGAQTMGLAQLLLQEGIHRADFIGRDAVAVSAQLAKSHSIMPPTYVMPELAW